MTDKVQKIKDWISKEQDGLMDAQGNFEFSEHEGAYHILCNLDAYIDTLQEEPVSKPINFEKELYKAFGQVKDFTLGMQIAKWFYDMGKNSQEPVSEELEEEAAIYIERFLDGDLGFNPRLLHSNAKLSDVYNELNMIFKAGAKWQKTNLWKPADSDDLPEIDREVIAILDNGKVVFAHRPNPNGWDGKSVTTGKVEHYIPKTYDKGGWNIPDVKYWLDVKLPKEIEL